MPVHAQVHRDAAALHRRGLHHHVVQFKMPASEAERFFFAQALDYLQHLFQTRRAGALVHLGVAPLRLLHGVEGAADAHAQLQPAAGNQVHRAHHLRQQHGMPQCHQHYRRAQPHPRRSRRDGRQRGHGLQAGLGRQAVADPHRIEAGLLRPRRHLQHRLGVRRLVVLQQQAARGQQTADLYLSWHRIPLAHNCNGVRFMLSGFRPINRSSRPGSMCSYSSRSDPSSRSNPMPPL